MGLRSLSMVLFGSVICLSGCQTPGRPAVPADASSSVAAPSDVVESSDADPLFPRVVVSTSRGDFTIELNGEEAPETVLNFSQIVRSGYYAGTIFHRVVSDVLFQGGGFTEDLARKPFLETQPASERGVSNGLPNERFSVALLRGNAPREMRDTEFYINVADNLGLDEPKHRGRFAVFGRIVDGFFAVEKIRTVAVAEHEAYAAGLSAVVPVKPITIQSVRFVTPFNAVAIQAQIAYMQARAANRLADLTTELEEKAGRKSVETESGLIYVDFRIGQGAQPFTSDTIEFAYHGTLLDGTVFETTRWKVPVFRQVGILVTGLQEGVLGMREGGLRTMIVPPHLGFPEGIPGRIPVDATIVYEVELLAIGEPVDDEP